MSIDPGKLKCGQYVTWRERRVRIATINRFWYEGRVRGGGVYLHGDAKAAAPYDLLEFASQASRPRK